MGGRVYIYIMMDTFNKSQNFFLIAGPCAVEDEGTVMHIAETMKTITDRLKIPYVFKASYRKANRSSLSSFTGIGDDKALKIIGKVKSEFDLMTTTDIHKDEEAEMAAAYVDILQIPAFLARQTNLLVAAAKTDKIVNIKKGQFMSPVSMKFAAQKVFESGNSNILLTERGTMFGYQDLVVDFRSIPEMKKNGFPVVMDCTHALQRPNQSGGVTGGQPEMIETIAKAAIASGADGLFIETHPNPLAAKSDGANMLDMSKIENLLLKLVRIKAALQ